MKIKISSDSTCDLSKEVIEQYDIGIVALEVEIGDRSLKDGIEIVPEDIFQYVESGKGICHTSAVNVVTYQEVFGEYLKDYDAVVHFTISSDMSSCYQNACIAAEEFENVYIIDSRNLSTGIGNLVMDAADLAAEGVAPDEIKRIIDERTSKVETSFIIDSLTYLYKGGRCSGVAALGANLLKLKPCIEVVDGKMGVGKKYRGNFDKVILQYVRDRLTGRDDVDPRRIYVTAASHVTKEIHDAVEAEIRKCMDFDVILHSEAGCTVSTHCGPVCLGILFFRK